MRMSAESPAEYSNRRLDRHYQTIGARANRMTLTTPLRRAEVKTVTCFHAVYAGSEEQDPAYGRVGRVLPCGPAAHTIDSVVSSRLTSSP